MVIQIEASVSTEKGTREHELARCLSMRLSRAVAVDSALDIAVTLGCAAEFSLFPEERVFEQCTTMVKATGNCVVAGAIWVARHRCTKAGGLVRRFSISTQATIEPSMQVTDWPPTRMMLVPSKSTVSLPARPTTAPCVAA